MISTAVYIYNAVYLWNQREVLPVVRKKMFSFGFVTLWKFIRKEMRRHFSYIRNSIVIYDCSKVSRKLSA